MLEPEAPTPRLQGRRRVHRSPLHPARRRHRRLRAEPGPFRRSRRGPRPVPPVIRAGAPQERDHPFGYLRPDLSLGKVARTVEEADGRRVFLVPAPNRECAARLPDDRLTPGRPRSGRQARARLSPRCDPDYRGILPIEVQMYQKKRTGEGGWDLGRLRPRPAGHTAAISTSTRGRRCGRTAGAPAACAPPPARRPRRRAMQGAGSEVGDHAQLVTIRARRRHRARPRTSSSHADQPLLARVLGHARHQEPPVGVARVVVPDEDPAARPRRPGPSRPASAARRRARRCGA